MCDTRQRRELIEPSITEHQGKLINYAGDGFLAMFDSPVEAVRCAIVIHQGMVGRNTSLPREQWILYRIGVHLGHVIVEPDGVFGDGVNIAAQELPAGKNAISPWPSRTAVDTSSPWRRDPNQSSKA